MWIVHFEQGTVAAVVNSGMALDMQKTVASDTMLEVGTATGIGIEAALGKLPELADWPVGS